MKELKEWTEQINIYPVKDPVITVEEIQYVQLEDMSLCEIEDFMLKINSYLIFLGSIKGALCARIRILRDELADILFLETQRLGPDHKFKTIEEKTALVVQSNLPVQTKRKSLAMLEAKFERLKDIPFAIKKHLGIIEVKHRRLMYEQRYR